MNKQLVGDDIIYGPITKRKCTDCLCCVLFTLFLAAFIGIGVIGFLNGKPELLLYPYDSSGHQCGRPGTVTEHYDYLYYVEPSLSTDYRVCVKSCPDDNKASVHAYSNDWVQQKTQSSFTLSNKDGNTQEVPTMDTESFIKHFCIPNKGNYAYLGHAYDKVIDAARYSDLTEWARDIALSFEVILMVMGLAVVLSIVYLALLRLCVGFVLWTSIFLAIGLMGLFGYYIYMTAENDYSSDKDNDTQEALKIASYVVFGLTGLFVLIVLFLCGRIRLAIAIMKSSTIFLKDVKTVFFIPVLVFLASVCIFIYWVLALVFIYSSGSIEHKDQEDTFASVEWTDTTRNSFYFELLGIIWVNAFKISLVQFTIACCVCLWYFSPDKKPKNPVCRSFYFALRYHLGSLAFGSLLLTLIRLLKWFLYYVKHKLYKTGYGDNAAVKCMCRCASCLVRCFEKCIEFLDKHAYIQIAMTGHSFCKAAADAFGLIVSNAARFVVTGSIGEVFTILGKVLIATASTLGGYYVLTQWDDYSEPIESPIPPTVICAVVSYLIAGLFMGVYDMVCDSVIHAFLIDEQHNVGAAPGPLKKFMKKHRDSYLVKDREIS